MAGRNVLAVALLGALSQIVATGLMLLAMNDRSFVVTTAYLKTEAIQTAIFGFIFLSDHLTVLKVIAILIATIGVVITALRPGGEKGFAELKPTIIGLVAAGFLRCRRSAFAAPSSRCPASRSLRRRPTRWCSACSCRRWC